MLNSVFSEVFQKCILLQCLFLIEYPPAAWCSAQEMTPKLNHSGAIYGVTYSPDGTTIATGGADKTVKIWSADTHRLLRTLYGHTKEVRTVSFSGDGTKIASGSRDHTIRVWSVSGELQHIFTGHAGDVTTLAFSPDGKYLLSGSSDKTLILWSIEPFKLIQTFTGHTDVVSSVAFAPDGKAFLSGSFDAKIKLWSRSGVLFTVDEHQDKVLAVAFSPDNRAFVSGSYDETIKIWERKSGKYIGKLEGYIQPVCLAISPDGNYLTAGDYTGAIKIWNLISTKEYEKFDGHSRAVAGIAFSPDGKTVVSTGAYDNCIKFWHVPSAPLVAEIEGYASATITGLSYTPGTVHPTLALTTGNSIIKLISLKNGRLIHQIDLGERCNTLQFFAESDTLVTGNGKTISLYSGQSGKKIATVRGTHARTVQALTVSRFNGLIASGSEDGTVKIRSILNNDRIFSTGRQGHRGPVTGIAFSPTDSDLVISGGEDGVLMCWSISKRKQIKMAASLKHKKKITTLAFSPDGFFFASGSLDSTVRIWSTDEFCMHENLHKIHSPVTSLCYSSDGSMLAVGSLDSTIRLYSTYDYSLRKTLKSTGSAVQTMIFSGESNDCLISGGSDRTIRFWKPAEGRWLLSEYLFTGKNYLIRNTDGYFDCPAGVKDSLSKYISISVSNTTDSTDSFNHDFHQPKVIDSTLATLFPPVSSKGPRKINYGTSQPYSFNNHYQNKYAVIIGISDYKYLSSKPAINSLSDLKYCHNDAAKFRDFITDNKRSGGDWKYIFLVDSNATSRNIDEALTSTLMNAKRNDLVFIFFSGHGRCHPEDPDQVFLLTYDFEPDYHRAGFSYDALQGLIKDSKAEHIIAFIDACKSGTIGFKGGVSEGSFNQDALGNKINQMPENKVIFTSGRSTQVSWEDDDFRMGIFTYFLIRGLSGEAPEYSNSNFVNLGELENYVITNVEVRTKNKILQKPQLFEASGLINEDFPVAIRISDASKPFKKK